jgi:predicted dehydrogenase
MSAAAADPVRVAVVGLGYWGPNIVRNLYELTEAELVAVCDLDTRRLERIARRYPDVHRTTSFDDLLDDSTVAAIAIATAVGTHFELAKAALEAGKHVFVEKPMAGSVEEAEHLVAMARARGLTLMPGHTFLYSPPVNAVRDLIRAGALGELFFMSMSRVNLGLHQSDASVIWDLGPHDLSILRYWLGESPVSASAMTRCCVMPDVPDVAFVNLQYASGTVAHVELSWLAPSKLRRTAIVGSERMVVYDDTSAEPVRLFDSGVTLNTPANFGEFRFAYRSGDILSPRIDATEPLQLEMEDFCASIAAGGEPRSSMEIGLDVLRVIEAIDRSLGSDGAPSPVEAQLATR